MKKSRFTLLLITLGLVLGVLVNAQAQETTDPQEEEKISSEKKAVTLLEQVATESAALRLPENRIRLQIIMGDLLWTRNEGRARSMFDAAAASLLELMRTATANRANNRRGSDQSLNMAIQLRRELLMAAAQHNSTLAYQLLQTTRIQNLPNDSPYNRQSNMEANIEQQLMAQIARTDPQLAVKNAEEYLDKGQYPFSIVQVIAELQNKDKDTAVRLLERLLKQLLAENLLAKQDASNLAIALLQRGPRPPESANSEKIVMIGYTPSMINETTYRELLEQVITTALSAQKSTSNNSIEAMQRERNLSQALLSGLQTVMPQIEKYAPTRVAAVRQKMNQTGLYSPAVEYNTIIRQDTSESLLAAAAKAPDNVRTSLYQRAIQKANEEGNFDRARQIINEHIDPAQRNVFLKMVESAQVFGKGNEVTLESVRQALSRLPSDEERFNLLIEVSDRTHNDNPKLALQILEEAQRMVGGRAINYDQLNNQLRIAQAFAGLDATRSFELIEPGIQQLNELFPAAQVLSGFDVEIFKDGEMLVTQGNNRLSMMVNQYGEQIGGLAQKDFDRALATAEKFQLPEARLFVRLAIARALLGRRSGNRSGRPGFPNPPPPRQP
jgi:hypothetical protein